MSQMFVLETSDGEAFVGQLSFSQDQVVIRDGYVGRPHVVDLADVTSIVLADEHPDVTEIVTGAPQPRSPLDD